MKTYFLATILAVMPVSALAQRDPVLDQNARIHECNMGGYRLGTPEMASCLLGQKAVERPIVVVPQRAAPRQRQRDCFIGPQGGVYCRD
jgi:hypothetical protein